MWIPICHPTLCLSLTSSLTVCFNRTHSYFPFCIKLQIYFTNCMQGAGVELEEGLWELRRAPTGWASAPERWTEWGWAGESAGAEWACSSPRPSLSLGSALSCPQLLSRSQKGGGNGQCWWQNKWGLHQPCGWGVSLRVTQQKLP